MAKLDIRKDSYEPINEIVFAEEESGCFHSVKMTRCNYFSFEDEEGEYVMTGKENIKNLIKALEKAVELGWDK